MSAKSVEVVPVRAKPQQQIVESLEEFLDLAKEGKLVGLAVVALRAPNDGGGIRAAWNYGHGASFYNLVGAVEDLKLDLQMSVREFKPL